ncbi:hypothetical protein ROHU_027333 [Labeo rohita]|uniref:Uncharacterized protein n=1 Tax=Labeo rohita TaxID=84645 RepID=A0A498MCL4_LABRO|nr:hypothetical protein ROHU_027333 [Labeo rohita]
MDSSHRYHSKGTVVGISDADGNINVMPPLVMATANAAIVQTCHEEFEYLLICPSAGINKKEQCSCQNVIKILLKRFFDCGETCVGIRREDSSYDFDLPDGVAVNLQDPECDAECTIDKYTKDLSCSCTSSTDSNSISSTMPYVVAMLLCIVLPAEASDVLQCTGEKLSHGQFLFNMSYEVKESIHDCEIQLLVDDNLFHFRGKVAGICDAEGNIESIFPVANMAMKTATLQTCPQKLECQLICPNSNINEKQQCSCDASPLTPLPKGQDMLYVLLK